MLIRVIRAVNDFILSAGFSDKDITGTWSGEAGPTAFGDAPGFGECRARSPIWPPFRPGSGPAPGEALPFALAFSPISI
jgi:hypothetical protein